MFKNMTIGKKIALGFALVLVLLTVEAVIAYRALVGATDGFTEYRGLARDTNLAGRLQANMLMVRMNVKDFLITGSQKDVDQYNEYAAKMGEFLKEADEEIHDPERAALIDQVAQGVKDYEAGFGSVVEKMKTRDTLVNDQLNVMGPEAERNLTALMESAKKDDDAAASHLAGLALRNLLLGRLYVVKYLDDNSDASASRVRKELDEMDKQLTTLDGELQNPERRRLLAAVQSGTKKYRGSFDQLVTTITTRNDIVTNTLDRIGPEIAKASEDVKLSVKEDQDVLGPAVQSSNEAAVTFISILSGAAVLIGIALSVLLARSITRALRRIIDSLTAGAQQTTAAASQVSASSQSLAEGASEQASSLEETSSSVEELTSMIRQNASNAGEARGLSEEARNSATRGDGAMKKMAEAIEDIQKSSDETSKIIKTIDDIAFQTNLLALNAAVEAARAGEAGKGFAVVAEEVRNLAQRSAEAAKTTSGMIEEAVRNSQNGVEISREVGQCLGEIAEHNGKVHSLISEIASASEEQARGIEQINIAVTQVDQVTQSNAANAEESASAAEELNAQAEELDRMVGELERMVVSGKRAQSASETFRPAESRPAGRPVARIERKPAPAKRTNPAEEMIPLDADKEMADF